jgi:hypothetical protein
VQKLKILLAVYNKQMTYQWDANKAASNFDKHGVDFADAVSVSRSQMSDLTKKPTPSLWDWRFLSLAGLLGLTCAIGYQLSVSL